MIIKNIFSGLFPLKNLKGTSEKRLEINVFGISTWGENIKEKLLSFDRLHIIEPEKIHFPVYLRFLKIHPAWPDRYIHCWYDILWTSNDINVMIGVWTSIEEKFSIVFLTFTLSMTNYFIQDDFCKDRTSHVGRNYMTTIRSILSDLFPFDFSDKHPL